jgi:DNA-nicking Smr family endonuclease
MPHRKPDADDIEAFRSAVRDVKPLKHQPRVAAASSGKRRLRRKPAADTPNLDSDMPLLVPSEQESGPAVEASLSFQRSGVRTQVMRKLKRGLYPADDELDLHGLTQLAARERLAEFLTASRDAGMRCVRIIHGKGYRSGARGPVLKTAVNSWLRRHLDVMAFVSARAIDGGTGALYVLLRA